MIGAELLNIDLRHIEREIYKRSLYEFVKRAFKILHPSKRYIDNWHIEYLCGELSFEVFRAARLEKSEYDALIINVPPRTLKSEIATVCFPLWAWTVAPYLGFVCSSYSESLSNYQTLKSKDLLNSNWFAKLWPEIKIKKGHDKIEEYANTLSGYRITTSTGGTITGKGGMFVIQDDPQNVKKATSDTERKQAIEYHTGTLSTRIDDPDIGLHIIIMQRLHEQDLTGYLLDDADIKVKHICIPAEYDPAVVKLPNIEKYPHLKPYDNPEKLLIPDRLPKSRLQKLKNIMGIQYNGQFQQEPSDGEGNLYKKEYFNIITWNELLQRAKGQPITWNYYVDGAFTKKAENDPTAIVAAALIDNCIFIRRAQSDHIDVSYLHDHVEKFALENGYSHQSFIKVEPKASGLPVIGALQRHTRLNVIPFIYPKDAGVKASDDKITRANATLPFGRTGRFYLVKGDWNQSFINQLCKFPYAKHDDEVDAFVFAVLDLIFERPKKYIKVAN